jgi:AcrR family transcriptional regulator
VTEVWQRPLRSDAERNRRLVLEAAAQAFAEEGFDVGMAEIARRAGVGNATVFRRFPSKDALVLAIFEDRIAESIAATEQAAQIDDPWDALVYCLEKSAELQARDRGFFQATEQVLLKHPELLAHHRRILDAVDPLVDRAQEAGVLRNDVTTLDVLGLTKAAVACIPPSSTLRADGWRRSLALILDGMRPEAATPLPVPPMTYEEIARAMGVKAADA